jgi:hypothetical protein
VERKEGFESGRGRLASSRKCCSFPALAEVSPQPIPFSLVGRFSHTASSLSATAFRALRVNSGCFLLYLVRTTLRTAPLFQQCACKSFLEKSRPFNFSSLVVSPQAYVTPFGKHVANLRLALQNPSRC